MIETILAITAGAAAISLIGVLVHRKVRQWRIARVLRIRSAHGIADERFVRIGGIDQWIGIRGEDRDNPILLVIHGGPGSSYGIFTPVIRSWEEALHRCPVGSAWRGQDPWPNRSGPHWETDV